MSGEIQMSFNGESKEITPPESCPVCGSKVVTDDGSVYYCPNYNCQGKVLGRVYKWVENLNIKFAGDKMLDFLVSSGRVKDPSDLYNLTAEDICRIPRMGEKHFLKMKKYMRTEMTWPELLGSLSIKHFNIATAELFCETYAVKDGYALENAIYIEKMSKKMGPTKSQFITDGLEKNMELIKKLVKMLNIIREEEPATDGVFSGKTFLFTETTIIDGDHVKRAELEKMVTERGGTIASSVTQNLSYLVTGDMDADTGKMKKARKLGINIISSESFLTACKRADGIIE